MGSVRGLGFSHLPGERHIYSPLESKQMCNIQKWPQNTETQTHRVMKREQVLLAGT